MHGQRSKKCSRDEGYEEVPLEEDVAGAGRESPVDVHTLNQVPVLEAEAPIQGLGRGRQLVTGRG